MNLLGGYKVENSVDAYGDVKKLMAARHELEFAAISHESTIGNKRARYLLPN